MKKKIKLQLFLIFSFALLLRASFAHEVIVHEYITLNAASSDAATSFAYDDFLNTVSSDFNSPVTWMVQGSAREDDFYKDEGGFRSLNHFYDPLTGQGLSDRLILSPALIGRNSFDWASISNSTGLNVLIPPNNNTSNIWSWQNARGFEMAAFLGVTRTNRANNFNNMFRALGQVMHLLEDTSQPQHVRNENHLPYVATSAIETYGAANYWKLNYANNVLDWHGLGFTNMQNFWDRNLYNGNPQALDTDASGGSQLGLAEFSNGNFLGERILYKEYFASN